MSATERTFALTVLPECDTTPAPEDEFVVIQMGALNLLIRDAFRPICRRPSLAVDRDIRLGLEAKMVLKYSCSAISSQWSSQRKQDARVFDVNLRSMQAIRSIGKGPTPLNDFWAVMNVSHRGLHQKTYQEHLKKALKPADEVAAQTVFADAVKAVKDVYKEMKMNSTKNITVVYDGTWLTCGHSLHIGVGCVIQSNSATMKFPLQRSVFDSPTASHRLQCIATPSTTNHVFIALPVQRNVPKVQVTRSTR